MKLNNIYFGNLPYLIDDLPHLRGDGTQVRRWICREFRQIRYRRDTDDLSSSYNTIRFYDDLCDLATTDHWPLLMLLALNSQLHRPVALRWLKVTP